MGRFDGRTAKRRLIIAGLAALATVAGPAAGEAQLIASSRFYKAVNPGGTVQITQFFAVDPQCRSLGYPVVNLLVAPHGGQVQTKESTGFPVFPANNVRVACNRKRAAGTSLFFTAAGNASGADVFDVEVQYPDGYARKYRYAVTVR